jgi:dTDP-4-dehydrorhamnose reductase
LVSVLDGSPTVLVIGASGQIAQALARGSRNHPFAVLCAGRGLADISVPAQIEALFREQAPAVVINAAAYTAVDRAESDEASAFAVNDEGPRHLARLCREVDAPLVHLSTDYVFSGQGREPYKETDPTAPAGVYGASKAAGEEAVRSIWPRHLILRTAWIYSNDGHNFLKTMLRLGAERSELAVVNDQIGSPTWAQDVADAILRIVPRLLSRDDGIAWGTYHLTNEGEASWFDFASEIFRIARMAGGRSPSLRPIVTAEYPTPARRPAYSVLDTSKFRRTFGFGLPHWQVSLAQCLALGLGAGRAREAHR